MRARFLGIPPRAPRPQQARPRSRQGLGRQGASILEVNEITLREFVDGLFPQDVERIRQLIRTCETERGLAERNLAWPRETAGKGFRSRQQVAVDEFSLEKAEIALVDARGMLNRLVNYTGKKLVKAIKAKIEANRADLLALESSYQLESERLKRIEAMIANCTLRAPRDRDGHPRQPCERLGSGGDADPGGADRLPVAADLPDPTGRRPGEGQDQRVPDRQDPDGTAGPDPLRCLSRETLPGEGVRHHADLRTGERAHLRRPLVLCHGPFRWARASKTLQLGLSAEVDFLVETAQPGGAIPLDSVQFADADAYAAVPSHSGPGWRWKPIELGARDAAFAEVRSGLKPGDPVIAHPGSLSGPLSPTRRCRGPMLRLAR